MNKENTTVLTGEELGNINEVFNQALKNTQEFNQEVEEGKVIIENLEDKLVYDLKQLKIDPYKPHRLLTFSQVGKCKSVWRQMRRANLSVSGERFPKRPFNNRKGKKVNELKKSIYQDVARIKSKTV